VAGSRSGVRPLLLAHRGARLRAPENTLAAFDLALNHGCDGFEFDVRCTADQRLVLCHDPTYHRRAIIKSSYEILREDRGEVLERHAALACLEDVLARYRKTAFLDIELKVAGTEDFVLRALADTPPQQGFVVTSFLPEVIRSLCQLHPELPLGLICETRSQLARWPELPISTVVAHRRLITRDLISEFQVAKKLVFVWTVNDRTEMLQLAEMGVDAIISDDTELLCATLAKDRYA
jgi:glycerophosphoryl diester phosphodiesterase